MAANQEPSALATAAALLRGAHSAVLATTQGSQPYASLVTPALDDAARPILLLSNLAAHTKHLRVNPRCALFIQGTPPTSNPQTAPRLCLMGEAMTVEAELVRAIYLRAPPTPRLMPDSRILVSGNWRFPKQNLSAASRRPMT